MLPELGLGAGVWGGGTLPVGQKGGCCVVRCHFPGRSVSSLNSAPAGLGEATFLPFPSFGALICEKGLPHVAVGRALGKLSLASPKDLSTSSIMAASSSLSGNPKSHVEIPLSHENGVI